MKSIDMTTGNSTKKILLFTLPILLGNIFQQFYNMADTIIVGRYLGKEALAAVGASFPIMVFINSIIIGLCMGSGILFAELHGSKDTYRLSKAVSTSATFIFIITITMTLFSLFLLDPLLELFRVPPETLQLTKDYLTVVFFGLVFVYLYNMSASVLRAIGDSKTPLYFLVIAAITNIFLDIILVVYKSFGVSGAAIATVTSQALSGIFLYAYMVRKLNYIKFKPSLEKSMFVKVVKYSVLTSLQQSIMNFGILLIQGLVNSFGVITMAAFATGVKIDTFAYMPAQEFGNAFATYVAQNKGARKSSRIHSGLKSALFCVTVFCILISIIIFVFAPNLIGIFSPGETKVILEGTNYLRIEGTFYILIGYLFLFYGFYRGMGEFQTSIILTVVSLGIKVILSFALVGAGFGATSIWWSIPVGWALADGVAIILYRSLQKNRFNLDDKL